MLINVIQEEESRVAIVDGGVLDFFEIETISSETLKGSLYKGVVENVNSSLEAAFVNCGWERPGFLPLDEVNFRVLPTLKGRKGSSRIIEHVAPGMEFLVQVIRDRFNSKPPSLTTYYSLPGRYLVLSPFSDGSGISRRIEDEDQRAKLRQMVEELNPPEGFGVIVRTAGLDQDRAELVRDMGYLLRLWETVERAAGVARAPSLIYRERDLALRTIRDHLMDDIEEVWIDDKEVYENAVRFIRAVAPHQEARIQLYTGDKPVFSRFNLEDQIETIYKRSVPLKSGGEIVIEGTEAMTAIDVNSSRSREGTAEEMALKTNVEAAAEIARQLRLRDLGGLIVIDFIDMEAPKHLRAVEKALREAMHPDKAKYDATRISKLGILEISRQRLKAAKAQATYVTCPACEGSGTVRTTEAAALAALRRIQMRVVRGDIGALKATLPTDVALYLLNQKREEILRLESRYAVRISLIPRPDYAKERCDIETAAREGAPPWIPPQPAYRPPAAREDREPTPAGGPEMPRPASAAGGEPSPGGPPWEAVSPAAPHSGEIVAAPSEEASPGVDQASEAPGETEVEAPVVPGVISEAAEVGGGAVGTGGRAAPAGPKRRRHKRGGRGRKRGPGEASEEPLPVKSVEAEEIEGRIVWEDVPEAEDAGQAGEPGGAAASDRPAILKDVATGAQEAEGAPGAPSKKRRRRRRGGRGRKKHTVEEEAALPPERAAERAAPAESALPGSGSPQAPKAAQAGPEAQAVKKRRRRRHSSKREESARPRLAERGAVSPSATSAPSTPSAAEHHVTGAGESARDSESEDRPEPQDPQDEDVPGGWWSRLRGPKKRGGRES